MPANGDEMMSCSTGIVSFMARFGNISHFVISVYRRDKRKKKRSTLRTFQTLSTCMAAVDGVKYFIPSLTGLWCLDGIEVLNSMASNAGNVAIRETV